MSERGTDARDNGYHFYRYLKMNHPEIKVYYIIDKKSVDYEKVKEDAVQYGSLKNYWIVANAQKLISSHYAMSLPGIGSKVFRLCRLHKKFYFLQHGITQNSVSFLMRENAPMRLFVCGAKPEFDFITETFGHEENVVQYTGFARYDALEVEKVNRQILLMPTWRQYIKTEEQFLISSYYQEFQKLINDDKLIGFLEQENIDLIFYPHYEIQKWLSLFSSKSKNIILASFSKYDVQTLLKESSLLITDYSSVFFDFAYMEKPVVYFQFDEHEFFENHYAKGYFDYRTMGFGEVCNDTDNIINYILEYANIDFKICIIFSSLC